MSLTKSAPVRRLTSHDLKPHPLSVAPAHKHGCQKDKQRGHSDGGQARLLPARCLIYLPLLCQAPLQVSNPCLTANQLRLQLLPRLTDRAQSQSKSRPRARVRRNKL